MRGDSLDDDGLDGFGLDGPETEPGRPPSAPKPPADAKVPEPSAPLPAPPALPYPPVPSDADLRGFRRMPLDVVALQGSSLWLAGSPEEIRSALALWMAAWHQVPAGSLPNDERIWRKWSLAGSRWHRVKARVMQGWALANDGRLYHQFLGEIVATTLTTQHARSKGGKSRQVVGKARNRDSSSSTEALAQGIAQAQQGSREDRINPLKPLNHSKLTPAERDACFEGMLRFIRQRPDGSWCPTDPEFLRSAGNSGRPNPGEPFSPFSLEHVQIRLAEHGFRLQDGFAVPIQGDSLENAAE